VGGFFERMRENLLHIFRTFGIHGDNQEILIEIFATFYNVLVEANDLFNRALMKPFGHVVEIL
jgi:hypothetical protein